MNVFTVGKPVVISILCQVLGGDQLALVPLAVQLVEHLARVVRCAGLQIHDALLAVPVDGDVHDLGI